LPFLFPLGSHCRQLAAPLEAMMNQSEKQPAPESEELFVKGLPLGSTNESVKALFSQYGNVYSAAVLPVSAGKMAMAAFVNMSTVEDARNVVQSVSGQIPGGLSEPVDVSYATPRGQRPGDARNPMSQMMQMMKGGPYGKGAETEGSDTCFVKSLPLHSNIDSVKGIFTQYGAVKSVKVLQPSKGLEVVAAFVEMSSPEEAKWLVENVNGQTPTGLQNPVEISLAAPTRQMYSGKGGGGGGGGDGKGMMMAMMGMMQMMKGKMGGKGMGKGGMGMGGGKGGMDMGMGGYGPVRGW